MQLQCEWLFPVYAVIKGLMGWTYVAEYWESILTNFPDEGDFMLISSNVDIDLFVQLLHMHAD